MENSPGPSTPSEPAVNIQKPLNNSSVKQGFLAVISLLPCVISGAILGYTGLLMWDLPLTYRNTTWFASLAFLGAAVGCLISQSMINAFGLRGTILLSHVVCAIGWALTVSSLTSTNFLVGRALTGVFAGIVSVSVSAYSAECFPTRSAARPVVYTALGVLCVYLTGSLLSYAQTAAIALVATVASFVSFRLFVPESPAWLESRGRVGDAEYSKLRLRLATTAAAAADTAGTADVARGLNFLRHANQPDVYRPFLALCVHLALQQLSGPLVFVSYATQLVGDSGIRVLNTYFIAVVLATFLVVGSLVSTAMNHRESTAILSATGVLTAGFVMAAYNLARQLLLNRLGSQLLSFIPLMALIMFAMSSSVALVPCLPTKNTPGEHVAVAFNYVVAFAIVKSYSYVHAYMGWWVFAFFAAVAALNIVYDVLMFSDSSKSSDRTAKQSSSTAGPAV